MRVDAAGWLDGVRHVPSPNFDARPDGMVIDTLVIHNISLPPGEFGGPCVEAFFTNQLDTTLHPFFEQIRDVHVSSHVFIRRDGEIVQFVAFTQRAWHAGESWFDGRTRCNDFSIGIELEGADTAPYDDRQYAALVAVTRVLMATYPRLTMSRIIGHCHIAPHRKTDPGPAFDWQRYLTETSVIRI